MATDAIHMIWSMEACKYLVSMHLLAKRRTLGVWTKKQLEELQAVTTEIIANTSVSNKEYSLCYITIQVVKMMMALWS